MTEVDTMTEETEPIPLDGDRRHRRKWVRFDPTLSSGQIANAIVLLLGFLGAYATYVADRATTALKIAQIELQAAEQKIASKEAMAELRTEVRKVQDTVTSVDKAIGGIQAVLEMKKKEP